MAAKKKATPKAPAADAPKASAAPEPVDVTTLQDELSGPVPTADTPTLGIEQTQEKHDQINAQGYVGTTPDDAPSSAYTHPAHTGGK